MAGDFWMLMLGTEWGILSSNNGFAQGEIATPSIGIKAYKLQDVPEWKPLIFLKGDAKQEEKS